MDEKNVDHDELELYLWQGILNYLFNIEEQAVKQLECSKEASDKRQRVNEFNKKLKESTCILPTFRDTDNNVEDNGKDTDHGADLQNVESQLLNEAEGEDGYYLPEQMDEGIRMKTIIIWNKLIKCVEFQMRNLQCQYLFILLTEQQPSLSNQPLSANVYVNVMNPLVKQLNLPV